MIETRPRPGVHPAAPAEPPAPAAAEPTAPATPPSAAPASPGSGALAAAEAQFDAAADLRVLIPGTGAVESLNVSVACAVALAEAWRRRGG